MGEKISFRRALQQNSKKHQKKLLPKTPGCSFINGGDVNEEGVDSKEEDKVTTSEVLEAFKQQKFHLKKIKIQTAENSISKRFVRSWSHSNSKYSILKTFVRVQTCTYLELIKPEGINHVDDIEKEVSCQAGQNQRLSGESARTGFQCDQTRSHPKIFKLLRVIFNRKYSIESMR